MNQLIEDVWADMRFGARQLLKSPAFTIIAVLTIAIAIGANTAIFTQVNAVFWKTLPVERPEELRTLVWTSPRHPFVGGTTVLAGPHLDTAGDTFGSFSYPTYVAMRDGSKSFSDIACWLDAGENRPVVFGELGLGSVQFVSGNYFRTLGVSAAIGRTINPDDDAYGAGSPVAVLSYPYWKRVFGGDPAVTRRPLTLNGKNFSIVGVLPQGFFGMDPGVTPDVMVPMNLVTIAAAAANPLPARTIWTPCTIVARLRRGVANEQARIEAENLVRQDIDTHPPTLNSPNGPVSPQYDPPHLWILDASQGKGTLKTATSGPLLILMAAVTGILLIACANIAGLLLARGTARQKEIATRLAIGAPRTRLVRQLVTESLLLSIIGGAAGIFIAYTISRVMPAMIGNFAPLGGTNLSADYLHNVMLGANKSVGVDAGLDSRVLSFSGALVILTGLVFGLAPALRATRIDLVSMMKLTTSSTAADRSSRFTGGKAMVTIQAALSMLLLIGAGLFIRTIVNLRTADLGYHPEGLLYVRLEPRIGGFTPPQRMDFFENALTKLESTPGVITVTGSFFPPLGSLGPEANACTPDFTPDDTRDRAVTRNIVAPRYFETMKLPLILGREFTWSDRTPGGQLVVIVNEAFARRFFKDRNPIGQRMGFNCPADPGRFTIVAVVKDSKSVPRRDAGPTVYQPLRQAGGGDPLTVAVRTFGDPLKMASTIRKSVQEVDSRIPTFGEVSPSDLREQQMSRESTLTNLLVFFGAVALLLSCLGIYGLLAYTVSRRTPEIGIRMALGAQTRDVIRLVVQESLVPVGVGLALGLAAAFALSRLVESVLYGVSKNDPLTILGAIAIFVLIAAVAAALPANRACRIDPKTALRYE